MRPLPSILSILIELLKSVQINSVARRLQEEVVLGGTCVGCGACVAIAGEGSIMKMTDKGPVPCLDERAALPDYALQACPGLGISYPSLYKKHYGHLPSNWLTGVVRSVRVGHASCPEIRKSGASGGVLTQVLSHLLETNRVDAVVAVRQGVPVPEEARAVLCRSSAEIRDCAQSVYIPVSTLDILREFEPGKRYAMTLLPDAAASLRVLQTEGFGPAMQVTYVVGPYTGTALYPSAIRAFLRMRRVPDSDPVTRLRWRAGNWPGHLEIQMGSGRIVRTPKVYYNFLIPFFVTQASLQSMDFANEFADLAVGDAWSPAHEAAGGGHSVFVTRSPEMETIIRELIERGLLTAVEEDPMQASAMHGHMLDFKKRGGYIRNQWRRFCGLRAPDFGYRPARIALPRYFVEIIVSSLFLAGRLRLARWALTRLPEEWLGRVFNRMRLLWKSLSKPAKRKGLANYKVDINGVS